MIAIAVVSLSLGVLVHRERTIERLDRMVIDQEITVSSAEANLGNAMLAREAAEDSLGQYTKQHDGPRSKVLPDVAAQAALRTDQVRLLANYETEQANAEKAFAQIIERLDQGTYAAALAAPIAAQTVIRHYSQTLERQVAATQASKVAGAQGPLDETCIRVEESVEKTRGQERLKKMILDYEKAYLKCLKQSRANVWW